MNIREQLLFLQERDLLFYWKQPKKQIKHTFYTMDIHEEGYDP
jgi:hypothetical protein